MYLAGGTVLWVRLEVTAAAAMALADSVHAERGETERAAENATQRGTEDRDRRGSGACAVLPTAPPAARNDITALENGKDVPCPWRRGAESSAGYWSTRASDRATCDTLSRKTVTGVTQGARRPRVRGAAGAAATRDRVGAYTRTMGVYTQGVCIRTPSRIHRFLRLRTPDRVYAGIDEPSIRCPTRTVAQPTPSTPDGNPTVLHATQCRGFYFRRLTDADHKWIRGNGPKTGHAYNTVKCVLPRGQTCERRT